MIEVMRRLIVVALVIVAAAACTPGAPVQSPGASIASSAAGLALTWDATFPAWSPAQSPCASAGMAWNPLVAGSRANLTDGNGNTAGLATIVDLPDSGTGGKCHTSFVMADVTRAKFYTLYANDVKVADYAVSDFDRVGWKVSLIFSAP